MCSLENGCHCHGETVGHGSAFRWAASISSFRTSPTGAICPKGNTSPTPKSHRPMCATSALAPRTNFGELFFLSREMNYRCEPSLAFQKPCDNICRKCDAGYKETYRIR